MKTRSVQLNAADAEQLLAQIASLATREPAQLAFVFGSHQGISTLASVANLKQIAQHWLASSSCLGAADTDGLNIQQPFTLSLLLVDDPEGCYGVAAASLEQDPAHQAMSALEHAMQLAGKPYELPQLIWCTQAPGQEEKVLQGLQQAVGNTIPIFGGSSADNDVSGQWLQFDGQQLYQNGVVVVVLYPSRPLSSFFSSGYAPLTALGRVSAVNQRKLGAIDDQPAAHAYNSALQQQQLAPLVPGNVLMASTFNPLGRMINQDTDLPLFLLSHPAYIDAQQQIDLFSEVQSGETLYLMHGDKAGLIARAAEVVKTAKQNLLFQYDTKPAGAVIVFCGGCMLAVQDQLEAVQQGIAEQLPDVPFVVTFTFGEQGCFVDGSSRHGNLMISAVLFGE